MLDALHFCHVCKSVCFCLNQKLVVSLVPRVLTPVTHVTPPLDRPTSGYKFSSVGNYIQSSKVSLHVRLKDGHYPDEMPANQMPDAWGDQDAWCPDERPPWIDELPVNSDGSPRWDLVEPWPQGRRSLDQMEDPWLTGLIRWVHAEVGNSATTVLRAQQ